MSTVRTSRHIPASPAAVFAAFAAPDRLAKWWGPDGFRNTFALCEFKPGGAWRFTMHGPDGTDYPNESVFAEIEAERKVVIDHVCQPLFRQTVELFSSGTGTLVQWTQAFDDPAFLAAARHIIEPANDQNLQRLAAEVAAA
ncbi:MAG: SRPBCC domain-containing protein [Burkholderiales bacterium]|nr:SRPBCC domain-containing protein [Burkholderiales bacterium]